MAVAATELAVLAGADRIEGTLFGHGQRTGNVDLVTVANNFSSRGLDVGLDFSNVPHVGETVERLTGMPIYYRQPYAGKYVFTAFSGSHQDAINKGMRRLNEVPDKFGMAWKVPYLHIDPAAVGRKFERLICINSQSGKGGVDWVLEQDFGLKIPKAMLPELSRAVQRFTDGQGREISSDELYRLFEQEFLEAKGPCQLIGYWPRPDDKNPTLIHGEIKLMIDGEEKMISSSGNGPISAVVKGFRELVNIDFMVDDFHEQAIGKSANARAMAYVPLRTADEKIFFGVGTDTNIDQAAVKAVVTAMNRAAAKTA